MLWFGLGTVPALLLVGQVGSRLPVGLRPILARSSGVAVIAFAIWTMSRAFLDGADAGHHHHHHIGM